MIKEEICHNTTKSFKRDHEWSLVHRVSNGWVGLKRNHDNILLNILKNDWWSW